MDTKAWSCKMKKIPLLLAALGGFVVVLLAITQPAYLVMAVEPTPTAPATPCRLSSSTNCDFLAPVTQPPASLAEGALSPGLYPEPESRNVPTHTLVSVGFGDMDMDASTINSQTFYVTQGEARIEGAIDYIDSYRIAIFYPVTPLLPETTYTARVSRGARDTTGLALPQDWAWSFTTSSGEFALAEALTLAGTAQPDNTLQPSGVPLPGGGMNIYFGDLHSHSFFSDGWGMPDQAYATARAVGLDFLALTDHGFMVTPAEWQATLAAAEAATSANFVGLGGFEYSHLYGHINVFDTESYVHRDDPNYDTLAEFYAWLTAHPTALAQFNHPLVDQFNNWNFNGFAHNSAVDHKIVLRELSNAAQYFLSLNQGWYLGATGNSDTHNGNFGERRMGVLAPALTRTDILNGLRARRTFFASPNHFRFAVAMQANGYWMGSAVPNTGSLNFVINAYDPYPNGQPLRLNLYNNGQVVASTSLPSSHWYSWGPTLPATYGHYYFVEAYFGSWLYPAYTSPVWVKQSPVAEAGANQVIAPGDIVTLNGDGSWDPDGEALFYSWTQLPNSTATINQQAHLAAATFVAPNIIGDMILNLTVTDPGGLKNTDVTVVSVTNKPILSITKSGPATVEPGELITYVLTVKNRGISAATEVVITDVLPAGASYVSGGALLPGNIVSWMLPTLAAGGTGSVSFSVTAAKPIINRDYQASCPGCIPAIGQVMVVTNGAEIYLPLIRRSH